MAALPVWFGPLAGLLMLACVFDLHNWNTDRMLGVVLVFVARPLLVGEQLSAWMLVLAVGCAGMVAVRAIRRLTSRMEARKKAYWDSIE